MPPSTKPPLRLALFVDALEQPAWVERALSRALDGGLAEVVAVVLNSSAQGPSPSRPSVVRRAHAWWKNREYLLYTLYTKWDTRRFAPAPADDPFARRDIRPLIGGARVIPVTPRKTKFSDYLSDEDVAAIRELNVDVGWRIGFRILRGAALGCARFGVWSFHHGDNRVNRGGPAGFWEVMEEHPTTGTVLQVLSEELDGGVVLYRSNAATNTYSVTKNRKEVYWKASDFLPRTLRRLRDSACERVSEIAEPAAPEPYSGRLYVRPKNRELLPLLWRLASRHVRAKWRSLVEREQWGLAYHLGADTGGAPNLSPFRFVDVVPPKDRFWADPFPCTIAGRHYLVMEELPYATDRGRIAVLEVDKRGVVSGPTTVLERDYHLSYPFLFQHEGCWYMIPETASTRRVELYRAVEVPFRWELDRVLMEGEALRDVTLSRIGDRWWMFAGTMVPGASPSDELSLFHAPSPFGPWTPHVQNPVVSDARCARPAGALFEYEGSWYRPAQDGTGGYGGAVQLQRIVELSPERYREEAVAKLEPCWAPGLVGLHTVNAAAGLTVIDVRRRRRR